MTERGAFLTNCYDPRRPDAPVMVVTRAGETPALAWARQRAWLADKVIGEPMPTIDLSATKIKEAGYVGIYAKVPA